MHKVFQKQKIHSVKRCLLSFLFENAEGVQWPVRRLWKILVKFPQMIANTARLPSGWVSCLPPDSRGCKL
jgi:hypothetical protein